MQKSDIPLYAQVQRTISSDISTGEFLPGEQIPPEKELAETYQVSVTTARQAILNLVNEGLLVRKQGKGTFVTDKASITKNIATLTMKGDISQVVPQGINRQKVRVLEIVKTKPSRKVAKALAIGSEQEVIRVARTRSDDRVPVSYVKNYLPLEIGGKIEKSDLEKHSMLYVLRRKLGIPIKNGSQYIMATIANNEVASALSIDVYSPVFYLETVFFTAEGAPIDFAQTFYRSDRYRYMLSFDVREEDII